MEAEKVDGADKLLKLQIKVGDEQRQIVSGIPSFILRKNGWENDCGSDQLETCYYFWDQI
ncbi:MAG: hypothetical protein Ct9H300mP29_2640 [Candidatus Neomarinimicrobiota bacterium]|nr:MAG: hypothetical protein Ct9H300mP29_2640 [Candidatus Neomarinimicrobiota bacterium]